MPIFHTAIADDDVLRRNMQTPSVGVSAALDGNAVISRVENAVLDEHIAARLRIASVVVGTVTVDGNAAHDDVGGEHWMNLPHR